MIFKKYGETAQLRVENVEDLKQLIELPSALWATSSAPVEDFHIDKKFLKYLDQDSKGRIRIQDIKDATQWLLKQFTNPENTSQQIDSLNPSHLNTESNDYHLIKEAIDFIHTHTQDQLITLSSILSVQTKKQVPPPIVEPIFGKQTNEIISQLNEASTVVELYFKQCQVFARTSGKQPNQGLPGNLSDATNLNSALTQHLPCPLNVQATLRLEDTLEPYWNNIFKNIRTIISQTIWGSDKTEITYSDWNTICERIAQYKSQISIPASNKPTKALDILEKLLLLQKHLIPFCCNFTNFSHLYNPKRNALFEEGQLIIDGYTLAFTMRVTDLKKHKQYSQHSKIFIVYAEITDKITATHKYTIASPVTGGDRDSFRIGKRGLFYDFNGNELDAMIIDIIENPINLNEALSAPFTKAYDSVQNRFKKFAQAPIKNLEKAADGGFKEQLHSNPQPTAAPKNLLLTGSVAIAALGSSFAYITKTITAIPLEHIVTGFAGLFITAWIGAMTLAWLSLRKRDLTAFMEAAGWAVNLQMPLVSNLQKLFTRKHRIPKQAKIQRFDQLKGFLKLLK